MDSDNVTKSEGSDEVAIQESVNLRKPAEVKELKLDAAAVKLQKVYKAFRTRRKFADCAVVHEELWRKAMDFGRLKQSSESFNPEKPETDVSRCARSRTKAAKIGKGLPDNGMDQRLAVAHWLEVIDPRHRYGHNLTFYYDVWFSSESSQPFFHWLDIGDGKEVNLERCPRSVLQKHCIKYLAPVLSVQAKSDG